jgi:hypothetical protein
VRDVLQDTSSREKRKRGRDHGKRDKGGRESSPKGEKLKSVLPLAGKT